MATEVDRHKLKATIEAYGHTYSAEGPEDMTLDALMGQIIVPLILSIGYSPAIVGPLFKDGLPTEWDSAYE